ncbi:MFS transporter [Frankia umida]|uniref:MFS transporter n=1 Tax=Frankia umida TaxID=573489 RepID=UPI0035572A69
MDRSRWTSCPSRSAGIANWLANFVVGISYLTPLSSIGRSATFFLYAGIAIVSVVFMWLRVPEAMVVPFRRSRRNCARPRSPSQLRR